MPSSVDNVKIGICTVTFDSNDLGFTKGGVEVEVTTETYSVEVDQFGTTTIKDVVIGRTATATTPFAESTLETIAALTPGGTLITDGTDPNKKKVDVTTGHGTDLVASAAKLVLHPKDAADANDDVVFPKASTPGSFSFSFRHDAERIYEAVWTAYPDVATGQLLIFGDETAAA